MQELSEGIREATNMPIGVEKHLRETAKKWAAYVLESNQDEALEKGLAISRSIADYLNEIETEFDDLKAEKIK